MGFVYFSIPVISGYFIMQWAIGKSEANLKQVVASREKNAVVEEQNKAMKDLYNKLKN
jgi:hypothetical protein